MRRTLFFILLLIPLSLFAQTKFEYIGEEVITFTYVERKYYEDANDKSHFVYSSNHKQVIVPPNQCWIITEFFINNNHHKYSVRLNINTLDVYKDGKFVGTASDGVTPFLYLRDDEGKETRPLPLVMSKSFSIEYVGGAGYIYVRKFNFSD